MKKTIYRIWMVKKENGYGLFHTANFYSIASVTKAADALKASGYYSKVEII